MGKERARRAGAACASDAGVAHPERRVIGKPHPDRACQFKPFAALKGYYELIEAEERKLAAREERERRGWG